MEMEAFYDDLYKFLHAIRPFYDINYPEIPTVELDSMEANNRGPVYLREFDTEKIAIVLQAACDSIRCSLKFKEKDAIRDLFLKKLARSSQVPFVRRMPLPGDNITLLFTPNEAPIKVFEKVKELFNSWDDMVQFNDRLRRSLACREE